MTAPRRVWIVEDNRLLRESLRDLVGRQTDLECRHAVASCEEMFAVLDAGEQPDLALIDIGLPGVSGIEGVRRLTQEAPEAKPVILTIHAEDEKVFEALCAGARGYLLKPLPPAEILAALREVDGGAAPINPYIAGKVLDLFTRLGPPPTPQADYGLTGREQEILQELVRGRTMQAVGDSLGIAYNTVTNHVRHIYRKLHVRSRAAAVAKALNEDLV